jgi:hypothetical protein
MPTDTDWDALSDHVQIALGREALRRAAATIASQAEILAEEIEDGALADRGGVDALRLFASLVRVHNQGSVDPAAASSAPKWDASGVRRLQLAN